MRQVGDVLAEGSKSDGVRVALDRRGLSDELRGQFGRLVGAVVGVQHHDDGQQERDGQRGCGGEQSGKAVEVAGLELHLKGEFPHLDKITETGGLEAELAHLRGFYNGTRLHEGIGYVTPNDEHEGRGEAIRAARRAGLRNAHDTRVATRR